VAEGADLATLLQHDLIDGLRDQHAADRHVPRRQALRDGDQIRLDVERLAAEHFAGAAKAGDHLVGNQQNVMLLEHRLDLLEVGRRWHDHAARAHERLGDEGGDGVRPFA
jgi:hypothetical protein